MSAKKSTARNFTFPQPPASDASLIDWALWHHDHGEAINGYWLTPIRPGEKAAYKKDWSKKPLKSCAAVERHWKANPDDNIGLVPRSGNFWLDADDLDVLEKAENKHGQLPRTYTQRSLNDSLHFLLQGDVTNSPVVYFDGKKLGEIRGALNGQCIAAGSRGTTREGEPGTWEIEELAPPTVAPDWVFDLIKGSGKATLKDTRKDYGEPIDWDEEQAERLVEAAERGQLIKDYKGPFLEGERDNLTFQLFAEAKNRMIHPEVMLEAVKGCGIDGGLEDVVERKMQSAYHDGNTQDGYGSKVPAYWLPNHVFKAYVDGKPIDRPPADPVEWKAANPDNLPKAFPGDPERYTVDDGKLLPLLSGAAISKVRPVQWWIDDMVRDGPGLFWGLPKVGKTSLLASTAVAVMHGREAWGAKTHNPGNSRALYLATEDMEGAQRAVYAACLKLGVPIEKCRVDVVDLTRVNVPQLSNAADMKIVRDTMLAHNQKLLIVDVLAFAMAGQRITESEVITEAFQHVAPLFDQDGISSWLSSHSVKSGEQFFGSVTLLGSVHFDWNIDKSGDHIIAKNENMRGAASFGDVPRFAMEQIELPDSTDHRGKPATVMFPAFVDHFKKALFENQAKEAERRLFGVQQQTAIKILEDHTTKLPFSKLDLARAVINRLDEDLRKEEPVQFKKQAEALGKRFMRVPQTGELWRYRDENNLNKDGYALSFICPARP